MKNLNRINMKLRREEIFILMAVIVLSALHAVQVVTR